MIWRSINGKETQQKLRLGKLTASLITGHASNLTLVSGLPEALQFDGYIYINIETSIFSNKFVHLQYNI